MKTIKNYINSISSFFSLLILITSCTQYDSDTNIKVKDVSSVDEVDFFKSIIFLDGSITEYFGELANSSPKNFNLTEQEMSYFKKFQSKFVENMLESQPDYFTKFKTSILTKEYNTVSEAISLVTKDVRKYANDITPKKAKLDNFEIQNLVSKYDGNGDISLQDGDDCIEIVLLLFIVFALTINVSYNVNVNVNFNYTTTTNVESKSGLYNNNLELNSRLRELQNAKSITQDKFILSVINSL